MIVIEVCDSHNAKVLVDPEERVVVEVLGLLDLGRVAEDLVLELLKSDELPESASQLVVR